MRRWTLALFEISSGVFCSILYALLYVVVVDVLFDLLIPGISLSSVLFIVLFGVRFVAFVGLFELVFNFMFRSPSQDKHIRVPACFRHSLILVAFVSNGVRRRVRCVVQDFVFQCCVQHQL